MTGFLVGVGSSLVAAIIFSLLLYGRAAGNLKWTDFKLFWFMTSRLRANGIINFFPSRADYIKFRQNGTISQYISTADRELLYVGFWLAHGTEMSNVGEALIELVRKGVAVELVFIDPDGECLPAMANYFDIPVEEVRSRVASTIEKMQRIRESLDEDLQPRFRLKTHQKLLTASSFLMDGGTENAKILVDFKLFASGRDHSFGIEFGHVDGENTLYYRVEKSFRKIRASSKEISDAKT
jgi:hypothetical protein